MLQTKIFDVDIFLTHHLNRMALLAIELCSYAILQLVQCVSWKGSQIKDKSVDPTHHDSADLILYC